MQCSTKGGFLPQPPNASAAHLAAAEGSAETGSRLQSSWSLGHHVHLDTGHCRTASRSKTASRGVSWLEP